MPRTRYVCLIDEAATQQLRNEVGNTFACRIPTRVQPESRGVPVGMMAIHRFDADDPTQADQYFRRMCREGCPPNWAVVGDAGCDSSPDGRPWRFKDNLHQTRQRIGESAFPAGAERHCRANEQFRVVTRLLGDVNHLYHERRKENGVAILTAQDRHGVEDSLRKIEDAISTLVLMASAAIDATDPAYPALGIDHRRRFRLVIDGDDVTPDPDDGIPLQSPRNHKHPPKATTAK